MLMWKRFVSGCLALALVCNLLQFTAFAQEETTVSLQGTEATDTWDWAGYTPVSDQEGLIAIADDLKGKYYLTNDIALASVWEPIDGFSGILDGNGYTISNVSFTVAEGSYNESYAGLFISSSGTIRNLTVDFSVDLSDCTKLHFGGIACSNYGSIVNCNATGSIELQSNVLHDVGAIAGENQYNGSLMHCRNEAAVTVYDEGYAATVGGVVGQNLGNVRYCSNAGEIFVSLLAGDWIGGVIGASTKAVQDCFNEGSVTVDSGESTDAALWVGGIVGDQSKELLNCYNTGAITVNSAGQISLGGIVGCTMSTIDQCYNAGVVMAQSTRNSSNSSSTTGTLQAIGGIVGETCQDIRNCYNVAAVKSAIKSGYTTALYQVWQGGIVGYFSDAELENCYFYSSMSCNGQYYNVGGIAGHNTDGTVTNGYWCTSGAHYQCGNITETVVDKLTSSDFTAKNNFSGFDFSSVWSMGESYPELKDTTAHVHNCELINGYAATCTEEGQYQYSFCEDCGVYFRDDSGIMTVGQDELAIPAAGHSFTTYVSNDDATCTTEGTKTAKCAYCDTTDTVADADSLKDHTWEDTATPGVQACEACGATRTVDVASGTCGANLTWTLDGNGLLVIRGTGEMDDYLEREDTPWYVYAGNIVGIQVEQGVTTIGKRAFEYLENLESVTIAGSVTNIGVNAFSECSSLHSVSILGNVTHIEAETFYNCTSLTTVELPDSITSIGTRAFCGCKNLISIAPLENLTSIGNSAFSGCSNLGSAVISSKTTDIGAGAFNSCGKLVNVTIPDSVVSIGALAFGNIPFLENVSVEEGNAYYCSEDGVLYNADKTELILYPAGNDRTNFVIPDSVTNINQSAFQDSNKLEAVTIPYGVTSVGEQAFYDCSNLSALAIPESVTEIGDLAFAYCSSLSAMDIPGSVSSIVLGMFSGCTNLNAITIPDSVTSIGAAAFCECTSLTTLSIPESVTSISDCAFDQCRGLESVYFYGNVPETFAYGVFNEVSSDFTIYYIDGKAGWTTPTWTAPDGTVFNTATFEVCEEHQWENDTCMEPRSCTVCGYTEEVARGHAFINYVSDDNATCTEDGTKTASCDHGCGTTKTVADEGSAKGHTEEIVLGKAATCTEDGLTDGAKCTVCGTTTVEQTIIPAQDHSWKATEDLFTEQCENCRMTRNITLSGNCHDTIAWTLDSTGLLTIYGVGALGNYPYSVYKDQIKKVVIEEGITSTDAAFDGFTNLTSAVLPDSMITVNQFTFKDCTGLTDVDLGEGVTSLQLGTFSGCTSLKTLFIPNSVTYIEMTTFSDCTGLETVTIDNYKEAVTIDEGTFSSQTQVIFLQQSPASQFFAGGEGTEANPYLVSNVDQLNAVRDYPDAHFRQVANIDMTGVDWVTIGGMSANNNYQFTGGYDGDGYEISNLTIESDLAAVGMFGYCMNATLQNITLVDLTVTVTDSEAGRAFVGGLAGMMCGTVENCTVSGIITANVPMLGYFGGICAEAQSASIQNCTSAVALQCSAQDDEDYSYAGGIVGFAQSSTIDNCINTGSVVISDNFLGVYAGGIVGGTNSTVENCKNSGIIDATTPMLAFAGGIAGESSGLVQLCVNTAQVSALGGSAGAKTGGICGVGKDIKQCANTGTVLSSSTGELYAGGIVAYDTGTVQNCYNVGAVSSMAEYDLEMSTCYTGGIAGYLNGSLDCVYSLSTLTESEDCTNYKGALAGFVEQTATLTDAYYCNCNTFPYEGVGNNTSGTSCSAAEMKIQSTYEGFDFTDVWSMDPAADYPYPVLQDLNVTLPEVELDISGVCGDNLTWSLDSEGTLTVSGTGKMYDYDALEQRPWHSFSEQITSVVMEEGATDVGKFAFCDFYNLKKVMLPETLRTIGMAAFSGCMSLENIEIPEAVTMFDIGAFCDCSSLTSIQIPQSSEILFDFTFEGCSSLSSITIPSNITSIDMCVFANCVNLTEVRFTGDCPSIAESTPNSNFTNVTANVYYPAGNHTWTSDVMKNYGGNLTWIPYCVDEHTIVIDEAVLPTCTESGLTEGAHCAVCNEILVAQTEVSAKGHTDEIISEKTASCTETGLTEGKKCSACGEILVAQQIIPKLEHKVSIVSGKAATCTEIGLTDGVKCSVCSQFLLAQTVIPATGHAWDEGTVNTASTCTIAGIKTYVCINDCSHTRTEAVPVIEHTDTNEDGKCDFCKLQLSCIVTFEVNGGMPVPQKQITAPGSYLAEPETPVRENYEFRGWLREGEDGEQWQFDRDTVDESITLYAKWHKVKHHIHGHVHMHDGGKPGHKIKLYLKQGNKIIHEMETDENGFYEMDSIPAGTYNLVAEEIDGRSRTTLVEIREDGQMETIHMPQYNVRAELIVPDEEGNDIVVGGLDVEADNNHAGDTHVTVTMKAGKTEDITDEEPEDDDKKAQKEAQKAIKEQAKNDGSGDEAEEEAREFVFLDIQIEKKQGDHLKEEITETFGLLEIRVPVETRGRRHFKVYRHHGDEVHELSEQPNEHGEFIEIHDGYVVIHAMHFSMYAVSSQVCSHEMNTQYVWSDWGCEVIHECALCDDPVVETTETVQFWLEDHKLKMSHLPDDLRLLVVGYDGGQMTGTQILTAPKLENQVTVEGDMVKLFFLRSDGSWKPLANAREL